MMDTVLIGLKWNTCLNYFDDVILVTFEEHLKRLQAVLEAFCSANVTVKPEKCHFGYKELKFVGHVVRADGVRPDLLSRSP